MQRLVFLIASGAVMLLIAACASPATPTPVTATETASPAPSAVPTETPTPAPVELSSLPGFEDWSVLDAPAVEIAAEDGALILMLKHRALWFMNQRGVLAYKAVEGDFKITAEVYTAKSSDPGQPPGGNGTVQLGGLMARNGTGGQENYVFIVVGDDGNGLSVETKNTTDSFSEYAGPEWDTSAAILQICRVGQTFNLYKRHVDRDEPWILAAAFERPDLPESLQVGLNVYSDSTPDVQVLYKNMRIENLADPSGCATN